MVGFVVRRLAFMLATLWVISMLIFVVTEVIPGDFATVVLGQHAYDEVLLKAWHNRLALDQPPHMRYLNWLRNVLRGEWGQSWYYH